MFSQQALYKYQKCAERIFFSVTKVLPTYFDQANIQKWDTVILPYGSLLRKANIEIIETGEKSRSKQNSTSTYMYRVKVQIMDQSNGLIL